MAKRKKPSQKAPILIIPMAINIDGVWCVWLPLNDGEIV